MASHFKFPLIPDWLFAPISSALLIAAVGLLGVVLGRPLLFASLGPTSFQLTEYPELKSSRVYNVVAGHFIALGMGFAAVAITNSWNAPSVLSSHHITLLRVWASVLAMLFTAGAILILRASHPPAGSTALLVSLGSFRSSNDALTVVIGVIVVGILAEGLRFWRIRRERATGRRSKDVQIARPG